MNLSPADPPSGLGDLLRFEMLLTELSARFVSVTPETIDKEIVNSQQEIVQALDLDRCTLGRVEGDHFVVTHSWCLPGVPPFPGYALKDMPWLSARMMSGEVICFTSVEDLPDEAEIEKEVVRRFGPRSNVTVPVKVGREVIGGMGFGTLNRQRQWPAEVVNRLRLFVDMVASAMARTRAEVAAQEAAENVRHLRERLQREVQNRQQQGKVIRGRSGLIGESPALRRVLAQVEEVAATNSNVLLIGETGTGKEVLASAIHELSLRGSKLMVKVSCAAIPATLIESELFGREKGAYTGALSRQIGRFELAHGSTLFLDEVGELPLEVQVKLLRVLEERQVERLGGSTSIKVDVRIIAATNRDLEKAVRERKFRDDLFYRLNVFPIRTPPLRERPDDIPMLVESFVHEFAVSFGKGIEAIEEDSIVALQRYSWPGNIRELRNTVERAVISAKGPRLHITPPSDVADNARHNLVLIDVERERIRSVLEIRDGVFAEKVAQRKSSD
jgi:transcriptional regulator with GAF, ATPase, and Fis domain